MDVIAHLFVEETKLPAAGEWTNSQDAWHVGLLRSGVAYAVGKRPAQEIARGDVFVLSPRSDTVLRVSQLSDAIIAAFYFSPERLAGLLSLRERLALTALEDRHFAKIVPAREPVAQQFAAVLAERAAGVPPALLYRCRLLDIVAKLVGPDLPDVDVANSARATTLCRFDRIVSRLSESDLMTSSSDQLAQMCGCSVRHFRRVFRKHFQTSIRSKQTALRLQKASQLLLETDHPVIKVATASGYNHFGLFSATFKKRFGMTPSEWRKRHLAAEAPC